MEPTRVIGGDACLVSGSPETVAQAGAELLQPVVNARFFKLFYCFIAGGHGQRVTREGAGLIDRAERRDRFHDLTSSTVSAHRQAAPDDLTAESEVRRDTVKLLRTSE